MTETLIMFVQYSAVAILFFEMVFAVNQKPSEMQKYVILLTAATLIMFVGYNVELTADNLEEAIAGTAVSYIGKPYVMLFSYAFIATFYEKKINKAIFTALATFCSIFSILVFENSSHHLYYATTAFERHDSFSPLYVTRGPLYFLYMATVIVFFLSCISLAIKGFKSTKSEQKRELSAWIIAMICSGIIGYIVYLSGYTGGYDTTMLGVFGSVLCLFVLFIKCRIFDTISIAKDQALDDSMTGLIIEDVDGKVVFKNKIIDFFTTKGMKMEKLFDLGEKNSIFELDESFYKAENKKIEEKGQYVGKIVEITDVTAAQGYQNRLEKEVKERTEKIEVIQRSIIASMANIVEARSTETGQHIKRCSDYSKMIADSLVNMGIYTDILTPEYINLMVDAAPLHDIGKIAIPDKILLKPGKLTKKEHDQMKLHVDAGAKIVEQTMKGLETEEYVEMALNVVRYHHERWDGTGYTKGMVGENIPLCARIVCLADYYDALVSKRVYKKAYSKKVAINIISEESGKHFDPNVVKAFLVAIDKK